jgi:hypothetical protein
MSLTKVTYSMIDGTPVNIKDFGAVGDGVTDDTAAIVAAYNSISSTGGTLYFPNENGSVYAMSGNDTLRIRHSNINIVSDGATVKLLNPFAADYLYFSTVSAQNGLFKIYAQTDDVNDYIENINIDGLNFADTPTITGGSAYNITIQQTRNVRITNCTFARAATGGILTTGSQYDGATAGGSGSDYTLKLLYQTNNVNISNCFFDGEGVQTPSLENNLRVGVQVEGRALYVTIADCSFKDCLKASVRNIGAIGTLVSNPQVWDSATVVNGITVNTIAQGAMQVGTSGRPDGTIMATAIECNIINPNIKTYHVIGIDTQRSVETTVVGGTIYNLASNISFTAVNGQNTVKVDSVVGRLKAKRHRYVGVFTNGIFSFEKPAGEDATYEDVTGITITGCNGWAASLSGVVSELNYTKDSNNFSSYTPTLDGYPQIFRATSVDPLNLSDGDYTPASIIVNSFSGAFGNTSVVQVGGSVKSSFTNNDGFSTGGFFFTTSFPEEYHPGLYVSANGVVTQVFNIVGSTINTVNAIPAGGPFTVSVSAPVIDLPNAAKGTTAQRPTLLASQVGFTYLDTTLDADGKPIWWNGTAWVDATGAVV